MNDGYVLLLSPSGEEESALSLTLAIELEDAGFRVTRSFSFRENERPAVALLSTALDRAQSAADRLRRRGVTVLFYGREYPWAKNTFGRPLEIGRILEALNGFDLLKREEEPERVPSPSRPGLVIEPAEGRAAFDSVPLELSDAEFALLRLLAEHGGGPVSADEIREKVFPGAGDSNIVTVYINYLRKKLDRRFDVSLIRTVRGVGYRLEQRTERKNGEGTKGDAG